MYLQHPLFNSVVNKKKKFRCRGGRDGALAAMKNLEKDGLGTLQVKSSKGTVKVSQLYLLQCKHDGYF